MRSELCRSDWRCWANRGDGGADDPACRSAPNLNLTEAMRSIRGRGSLRWATMPDVAATSTPATCRWMRFLLPRALMVCRVPNGAEER